MPELAAHSITAATLPPKPVALPTLRLMPHVDPDQLFRPMCEATLFVVIAISQQGVSFAELCLVLGWVSAGGSFVAFEGGVEVCGGGGVGGLVAVAGWQCGIHNCNFYLEKRILAIFDNQAILVLLAQRREQLWVIYNLVGKEEQLQVVYTSQKEKEVLQEQGNKSAPHQNQQVALIHILKQKIYLSKLFRIQRLLPPSRNVTFKMGLASFFHLGFSQQSYR